MDFQDRISEKLPWWHFSEVLFHQANKAYFDQVYNTQHLWSDWGSGLATNIDRIYNSARTRTKNENKQGNGVL